MSAFLESREHVFTWKVENFNSCYEKKGECLSSPVFLAESLGDSTWRVNFYPRGCVSSNDESVAVFLERTEGDRNVSEIKCEFEINVIGKNGKILFSNKKSENFETGDRHGWPCYKDRNSFLKEWENTGGNTLTIRCHLFSEMPRVKSCSENVAVTKVGVNHYCFRSVIKNVNTSSHLQLLKFPSEGASQIEVLIQIPVDDIEISIRRVEGFTGSLCVSCKVALLDAKGEERDINSENHLFLSSQGDLWEFPTYLKKSRLNAEKDKYLIDDCFTLLFDISLSNNSKSESIRNIPATFVPEDSFVRKFQHQRTMDTLRADLDRLYSENIHSDVNLRVEDQIFSAHRAILSARSPVFFAMFDHVMTESQTGDVEISDFEVGTMRSFLKFLYTGETEGLDYNSASKLMMAAEKYEIHSLKEICADFLKSILSIENVCDILIMADLVEHKTLKASSVEFITKHSSYIFCSDMWKSVIKKNLLLASETVSEISMLLATDRIKNTFARNKPTEKDFEFKNISAFTAKSATNNVFTSPFREYTSAVPLSHGFLGTATPASGFSFGQPSNAGSGGFGGTYFFTAKPTTNSVSTSSFGENTSAYGLLGTGTPPPSVSFGQPSSTSSGGFIGGFQKAANSGTSIKFNPSTGVDTMMKGGVSTNVNTRFQNITLMKNYVRNSEEELRFEDYCANRKGLHATPALEFGKFGDTTQLASGGLFGPIAASSESPFQFGCTTPLKPFVNTTVSSTVFSTLPLQNYTFTPLSNTSAFPALPSSSSSINIPGSTTSNFITASPISSSNTSKSVHTTSVFSTKPSINSFETSIPAPNASAFSTASSITSSATKKPITTTFAFSLPSLNSFATGIPESAARSFTTAASSISSSATNTPIATISTFSATTSSSATPTPSAVFTSVSINSSVANVPISENNSTFESISSSSTNISATSIKNTAILFNQRSSSPDLTLPANIYTAFNYHKNLK